MADLESVKPWIDAYEEARRQIKRYEDIKAQAKERILEALDGDTSGTIGGVERVVIREVAGRFDSKSLKAADPATYHRYAGSPTTRFEVIEPG